MKVKKDQLLLVSHQRKGNFKGIAMRDFDTEKETFYPIAVAEKTVVGMSNFWTSGDEIPCRNSLCEIGLIDK